MLVTPGSAKAATGNWTHGHNFFLSRLPPLAVGLYRARGVWSLGQTRSNCPAHIAAIENNEQNQHICGSFVMQSKLPNTNTLPDGVHFDNKGHIFIQVWYLFFLKMP